MIDFESRVPYYEQLADILRSKINSGELTARVPSIITLAQEYGISRRTAGLRTGVPCQRDGG